MRYIPEQGPLGCAGSGVPHACCRGDDDDSWQEKRDFHEIDMSAAAE